MTANADWHPLTGAYALDSLGELERRQFERHLADCPDCAREVDELRATAARLGAAVAEQPPDRLRRAVLDQIAVTRQEPSGHRRDGQQRDGRGQRPPRRWALRLTAAAAAIALAAAVALGTVALRTQHQLDAAQGQLAQARAEYGAVSTVFGAPDARAATGVGAQGGTAVVVASDQLNQAVLIVSGLPRPPVGHTYQAWLIGAGNPRSAGLLTSGTNAAVPPLALSGLAGAKKIGVTVEPAGGSPRPTTTPVMLFDLPT